MNPINNQRQLTTQAAHSYARQFKMEATLVNLTGVVTLELALKTGETVIIPAEAVVALRVLPLAEGIGDATDLVGFYLQVRAAEANFRLEGNPDKTVTGQARLCGAQDVVTMTFHTIRGDYQNVIRWNPLASDGPENLNQHVATTLETLTLWTWPQATYRWHDILTIATQSPVLARLVTGLVNDLQSTITQDQATTMLKNLIAELAKACDAVTPTRTRHLIVTAEPASPAGPWKAVFHDDQTGQDDVRVYLLTYSELLGMSVTLPTVGFWSALAWLLWKMAYLGTDKITHTTKALAAQLAHRPQAPVFEATATKIGRFLDAYVRNHVTDSDLAGTVGYFWPLTTGTLRQVGPTGPGDRPRTTLRYYSPQLLTEFMTVLGPAYRVFWATHE